MTFRALGDLMMVQEEALLSSKAPENETDDKATIADLRNHPWTELKKLMSFQSAHIGDDDPEDCRYQAGDAYKKALREYLSEVEEYLKRYRLSNDLPPKGGHMGVVCSCGGIQLA